MIRIMEKDISFALILSLFSGLSTAIGGLVVFMTQRTNKKLLSFSLGLSAGVMILVSFGEFMIVSRGVLMEEMGQRKGLLMLWVCFFIGVFLIGTIDRLIPSMENPHEIRSVEHLNRPMKKGTKLMRTGVMTALAISLHNFPEGIATLITAVENPSLGIAVGIAVAIHNIPEGIAVAVPVYQATQSKRKAFSMALLSGLAEPIGAMVAYFMLMPFITPILMAQVFAVVAGIMVFISLDELLPATQAYGEHHASIYGLITGMVLMATSLVFLV